MSDFTSSRPIRQKQEAKRSLKGPRGIEAFNLIWLIGFMVSNRLSIYTLSIDLIYVEIFQMAYRSHILQVYENFGLYYVNPLLGLCLRRVNFRESL